MGYIEDLQRTLNHAAPPKAKHVESLWRGTVTDVRSDGFLMVRIPALSGLESLGPMPSAVPAAVGDPVIVGAINGEYAELMVIAYTQASTAARTAAYVWNPASLADGASVASPDVALTGAVFGMPLIVAGSGDILGLTATAYVSAADTVKIVLSNLTGAPVDLASMTWTVKALRWP